MQSHYRIVTEYNVDTEGHIMVVCMYVDVEDISLCMYRLICESQILLLLLSQRHSVYI